MIPYTPGEVPPQQNVTLFLEENTITGTLTTPAPGGTTSPLPNVTISLFTSPPGAVPLVSVTTSPSGVYTLNNEGTTLSYIPDGTYVITASLAGYTYATSAPGPFPTTFPTTTLNISLVPNTVKLSVAVSSTLASSNLAGATVTLTPVTPAAAPQACGASWLVPGLGTTLNSNVSGTSATFNQVVPDVYSLTASDKGHPAQTSTQLIVCPDGTTSPVAAYLRVPGRPGERHRQPAFRPVTAGERRHRQVVHRHHRDRAVPEPHGHLRDSLHQRNLFGAGRPRLPVHGPGQPDRPGHPDRDQRGGHHRQPLCHRARPRPAGRQPRGRRHGDVLRFGDRRPHRRNGQPVASRRRHAPYSGTAQTYNGTIGAGGTVDITGVAPAPNSYNISVTVGTASAPDASTVSVDIGTGTVSASVSVPAGTISGTVALSPTPTAKTSVTATVCSGAAGCADPILTQTISVPKAGSNTFSYDVPGGPTGTPATYVVTFAATGYTTTSTAALSVTNGATTDAGTTTLPGT